MSLTESVDIIYRQYRLRVMLAITLGYGFLYTCRLALSVVKKPLIDNGIFSVEELGMIGAAMLYGYAFGKLVNGVLADHVSPRLFFAVGILMSALVNLSMSMYGGLDIDRIMGFERMVPVIWSTRQRH